MQKWKTWKASDRDATTQFLISSKLKSIVRDNSYAMAQPSQAESKTLSKSLDPSNIWEVVRRKNDKI